MLASSRSQWEEARRRLERERADAVRHRQLLELADVVADGLRRRIGSTFTLDELDEAYAEAETWGPLAISEAIPSESPAVSVADTSFVLDVAFDLYARGAVDHRP